MKPYEVEQMINTHGDIKLSELFQKLKFGNEFICPKCDGKGFTTKMVDKYPRGLPDSGWATDMQPVNTDCDLCSGIGYTHKEYKPIVETKIIGYK